MSRIVKTLALALAAFSMNVAEAQVWEKFIRPGMSYRMEVDNTGPRLIHVIRLSPFAPGLTLKPEVAGTRLFSIPTDKGREDLSTMVKRTGAIAGINADFFPFTADPLGAMVRDGQLLSRPDPRRAVFGWGRNAITLGKLDFKAAMVLPSSERVELNGLNEETLENSLVLYTDDAAFALAKSPCLYLQVSLPDNRWTPTTKKKVTAVAFYEDRDQIEVQPGGAILAARGAKAILLRKIKPGEKFDIELETTGFDWKAIDQVVGGGPFLLRDKLPITDSEAQGFREGFYKNRHPRTAIGRTAKNEILLIIVDGRQDMSVGCSIAELTEIAARLGCVDAINLDGGGSSTINLFGLTLNRPSDGQERKIANAVLLMGDPPKESDVEFSLKLPASLVPGAISQLLVEGPGGRPISHNEVFWAAQGEGWIDQGGKLRAMKPGLVTISAYLRGKLLKATLEIKGPQPQPTSPPKSGNEF